ncbi:MAG: radical SAM protein [Candidatus Ozemobacteraceae bacterium]
MSGIILINPKTSLNIENNEPLNLLSLAAYLRKSAIPVWIYDEIRPLFDLSEKIGKVQYIGITSNTCSYNRAVELARSLKKQYPEVILIAGGVHPTTTPEQTMRDGFDIVVVGEGERTLVKILTAKETTGIFQGESISELELYGMPRDLIDMDFYSQTKIRCPHDPNLNFIPFGQRMACYLTSRGCPFHCIFCHNIWRKTKLRFVSIDLVIEELAMLKKRYGCSYIWLMDDHIFINKIRARELFSRIIEERLEIFWASATRAEAVDDEILELAYRSGCRRLAIGVESGSQKILDKIMKGTTVETNFRAIRLCKKHKIRALSTIMIGNPDETREDLQQTMDFILRARPDDLAISILTPFPGTVLWKMCEEEGRIPPNIDFSKFNYLKAPVRITDHVSPDELEVIKRNMLIRYYLQPRNILPLIRKMVANPGSMYHKIIEYFR